MPQEADVTVKSLKSSFGEQRTQNRKNSVAKFLKTYTQNTFLKKIHLMDLIAIIKVYSDKGNCQGGEGGNW